MTLQTETFSKETPDFLKQKFFSQVIEFHGMFESFNPGLRICFFFLNLVLKNRSLQLLQSTFIPGDSTVKQLFLFNLCLKVQKLGEELHVFPLEARSSHK